MVLGVLMTWEYIMTDLFNNPMFKTISDIIKNYEIEGDEERMMSTPNITEQKLRKLIRDEFKKIN